MREGFRHKRVIWTGNFRTDYNFFFNQSDNLRPNIIGGFHHKIDPEPYSVKLYILLQVLVVSYLFTKLANCWVSSKDGSGYCTLIGVSVVMAMVYELIAKVRPHDADDDGAPRFGLSEHCRGLPVGACVPGVGGAGVGRWQHIALTPALKDEHSSCFGCCDGHGLGVAISAAVMFLAVMVRTSVSMIRTLRQLPATGAETYPAGSLSQTWSLIEASGNAVTTTALSVLLVVIVTVIFLFGFEVSEKRRGPRRGAARLSVAAAVALSLRPISTPEVTRPRARRHAQLLLFAYRWHAQRAAFESDEPSAMFPHPGLPTREFFERHAPTGCNHRGCSAFCSFCPEDGCVRVVDGKARCTICCGYSGEPEVSKPPSGEPRERCVGARRRAVRTRNCYHFDLVT